VRAHAGANDFAAAGRYDRSVSVAGRPRASAPKDTPRNFSREGGFADPRQPLHEESALGRGLMILRAFDIGEPYLGNAAIAERTGLAKATVSRLTQTLLELGYLLYRADLGKYE